MKTPLARSVKSLTIVSAAVVFITLAQGVARADELTVSGFSNACIGTMCAPSVEPPTGNFVALGGGLSFRPILFNASSVGGNIDELTLGAFKLDAVDLNSLDGQTIILGLTFNQPSVRGIAKGTIMVSSDGIDINFTSLPPFIFSNGGGSFDLSLNPIFIPMSGTDAEGIVLTGSITNIHNPAVPEPATLVLLATGLAGAAGAVRRRTRRGLR